LPTGDKDPFALRRHALGIVRMLMEKDLPLALDELIGEAVALFPQADPKTAAALSDFIYERLAGTLREQGYSAQEVDAVLALRPQRLGDVAKRLAAVRAFAALPEASALAAANKRIGNILRQAGGMSSGKVEAAALDTGAETELYRALGEANEAVKPLVAASRYVDILRRLAALREPVDRFFDGVMVMADDAAKRNNRLVLLSQLRRLFLHVADISLLPAPERSTGGVTQ
jgi:glycyl-tRNA synthetase beta chain